MAALTTDHVQTEGDLGGIKIEMSLDQNSLVHIIGSIASLYSDIKPSIVRELLTNGIDSHKEAGNPNPVKVTIPTTLSPYFIVQDFGVGMSLDDVKNVWAKVGYSTKRNNDEVAGRYGYGRISPLAYGSQSMTVTTVKDGKKTTFVAGSDATTGGLIEVLDSSDTDEPNGYTVKVLVSERYHHREFEQAVKEIVQFSKFPIEVTNGFKKIQPSSSFGPFDLYNDNVGAANNYYYSSRQLVVMGDVAYELNSQYNVPDFHGRTLVINVEMGEVDVTPSREGLKYNNKTKQTLQKYANMYFEQRVADFEQKIKDAKSAYEAYHIHSKLHYELRRKGIARDFFYKGERIPGEGHITGRCIYWCNDPDLDLIDVSRNSAINIKPLPDKSLAIVNYTNKSFTRLHLAKVRKYLQDNGLEEYLGYVFTTEASDIPNKFWFSNTIFVDWEDIKSVKATLPPIKKSPAGPKTERKWEGVIVGKHGCYVDYILPDPNKEILYTSRAKLAPHGGFYTGMVTPYVDDKTQVFLVVDSELQTFLRKYPNAKDLLTRKKAIVEEYINNLTDAEKTLMSSATAKSKLGLSLDPNRIDDPELKAILSANSDDAVEKLLRKAQNIREIISSMPRDQRDLFDGKLPMGSGGALAQKILDRYPLLRKVGYMSYETPSEHYIAYINAVFNK